MGADFLNSYTKMVDGEKDPRNLMLLFSMDRVILLEFDVKDLIEVCMVSSVLCRGRLADNSQDFFDITFCYFPISFKPPPNDPYGITAEDLKSALRKCMAASPYFAKLALPLFLEKYATAVGQSMVRPFVFCVSQHALKPIRRISCSRWLPVSRCMVEMLCANVGQSSGTVSRQR
jgi:DNA repair/transcription protein MET18/MMS19